MIFWPLNVLEILRSYAWCRVDVGSSLRSLSSRFQCVRFLHFCTVDAPTVLHLFGPLVSTSLFLSRPVLVRRIARENY